MAGLGEGWAAKALHGPWAGGAQCWGRGWMGGGETASKARHPFQKTGLLQFRHNPHVHR